MSFSHVKKVNMLIVLQPHLDQAIEFYEALGLKKQFELEKRWAEFLIGDIKLGLCITPNQSVEKRTGIVLEVEDLTKMYNELADEIEFIQEPKAAAHGVMATIKDPGGNLIDLYQPTPETLKEALEKEQKQ